jgi:hypothetical protein
MRDRFEVSLVCRTMRAGKLSFVTARGYCEAKSRPASARTLSDQLLRREMVRLHAENYRVYEARKIRSLGLRVVQRSNRVFTTKSDPAKCRPTGLVHRRF